jgi:hypothetical protein
MNSPTSLLPRADRVGVRDGDLEVLGLEGRDRVVPQVAVRARQGDVAAAPAAAEL